jgi:hypothetical protein
MRTSQPDALNIRKSYLKNFEESAPFEKSANLKDLLKKRAYGGKSHQ